jgi:hypothetical protein
LGDSAYRSVNIKNELEDNGYCGHIHHMGRRNNPKSFLFPIAPCFGSGSVLTLAI